MIQAACGECGSRFRVRPEHAGRRARCPKCGAALKIPDLPSDSERDDEQEPAAAPAPARPVGATPAARASHRPGAARRGARSGGPRRSTGGVQRSERTARRGKEGGINPAIIARIAVGLVVVAVAVAAYFMSGVDYGDVYKQGVEAMTSGKHEIAVARFEAIPAGHNLYPMAQEKLAALRELDHADEVRLDTRRADNLWGVIEQMRKEYVDGFGPTHPEYAANCRYLLKRAKEFIETYPDDPRVAEAKGLTPYYSQVASLDDPPTEADLRAEVRMRTITHDFSAALEPIAEYEDRTGETEVAQQIREELRTAARARWAYWIERLTIDGTLAEGEENWRRIVNTANKYLDSVEGLSGVSADAIELRDKGNAILNAGG